MKNLFGIPLFIICLLNTTHLVNAQQECTGVVDGSLNCLQPVVLCEFPYRYQYNNQTLNCTGESQSLWHKLTVSSTGFSLFIDDNGSPFMNANLYGPFTNLNGSICGDIASGSITPTQSIAMSGPTTYINIPNGVGEYLLEIIDNDCFGCLTFELHDGVTDCGNRAEQYPVKTEPCETCIGSFSPNPGAKYLISAWAKEETPAATTIHYNDPEIIIDFFDANGLIGSVGPFFTSGSIIEEWQRIEEEFIVPLDAIRLSISLQTQGVDVLFDDIRVLPFDGSMKSYVYDPINMRLAAELDERHYATFYEYDEEGKLVRIKKETEKGIMTIQESKNNTSKP